MYFNCDKTILNEYLGNVVKAASQKSPIAALEGIKIKLENRQLELTGYDMEIGMTAKFDVDSNDSGEFIINAKLFHDISRKMPEESISFDIDSSLNVTITSGSAEYKIKAYDTEEYPRIPEVRNNKVVNIPQDVLKSMISQTIFATAQTDNRPILTGELFNFEGNTFTIAALDAVRLALRVENVSNEEVFKFVVPAKALSEISRMLKDDVKDENLVNCEITTDNKQAVFKFNGYTVFTRLLEGEFNNYENLLNRPTTTEIIIDVDKFSKALERCSLLINSDKLKTYVKCTFAHNNIHIECKSQTGNAKEDIPAEISGDEMTIGFNHKFVLDALRASECDKVVMRLNAPMSPFKIEPLQGNSFCFLIMPMNIK
jgi:DNA polymerase-3 subunit beta